MILIVSSPVDAHVDPVVDILQKRGREFVVFDPATFPATTQITVRSHDPVDTSHGLIVDASAFDASTVRAAWYRRPGTPIADRSFDPTVYDDVVAQSQALIDELWAFLPATWLPGSPSRLGQVGKLGQLAIARALGFDTPMTLVTNDPDEFLRFYRETDGRLITKLLGRSAVNSAASSFARFTEKVRSRDLVELDAIQAAPVIVQEDLPKAYELRVTVVGESVFAARIDSQVTRRTQTDWRRYDHLHTPMSIEQVPDHVAERCRAITVELGLAFSTIDLVVTPSGRTVFLELNANGQYLWIERAAGAPISEAIATWLETNDQ